MPAVHDADGARDAGEQRDGRDSLLGRVAGLGGVCCGLRAMVSPALTRWPFLTASVCVLVMA